MVASCLRHRRRLAIAISPFTETGQQILELFQSGRPHDAAKIDIVASLATDAPSALRTEGLRIAGLVALLEEKPDRAADLFDRAVTQAANGSRTRHL